MTIAILTPSRSRPDRLWDMLDAIDRTAVNPEHVHVYVGVDDDDLTLDGYYDVLGDWNNQTQFTLITKARMRLAEWTNDLAYTAIARGHTILGSLGDDHRARTHGWDEHIRTALDNLGSGLAYGDDGLQGERLPTAPFWTADVIQALGWFFPPQLVHMYADNYWKLLADDIGRRAYLPDVLIEHLHPSTGKAAEDEINRENDASYDADGVAFNRLMEDDHAGNVARVLAVL